MCVCGTVSLLTRFMTASQCVHAGQTQLCVQPLNQALLLITVVCFGYSLMALRGASVQTNTRYLQAEADLPYR